MKRYIIEVKTMGTRTNADGSHDKVPMWLKVRPIGSAIPYLYDTQEEADRMRRMCYPEAFHETRITEV